MVQEVFVGVGVWRMAVEDTVYCFFSWHWAHGQKLGGSRGVVGGVVGQRVVVARRRRMSSHVHVQRCGHVERGGHVQRSGHAGCRQHSTAVRRGRSCSGLIQSRHRGLRVVHCCREVVGVSRVARSGATALHKLK